MRLYGIEAPGIIATCSGNFGCADDPGKMARDHLAELTRGQDVICTRVDRSRDDDGRRIDTVRCTMRGIDLSCAMIADGFAEKTDKAMLCPVEPQLARSEALLAQRAGDLAAMPWLWRWLPLFLVVINIATYAAFALDKYRSDRAMNRVAPAHLLTLTAFGGGVGGVIAQLRLDHLKDELPFANYFAILLGLQLGTLIGLILF